MAEKTRVICVGEVMVELARGADNRYGLSFGGATFNTAVYLARAGMSRPTRARSATIPNRLGCSRSPPPRA